MVARLGEDDVEKLHHARHDERFAEVVGVFVVHREEHEVEKPHLHQPKAEERRAMAIAAEQEMKAKAQEARAEVIQAEAEVPKALAQALRDGHMGFMDYYKLENLKGDTAMRENIGNLTKDEMKDILK